TASEPPLIGAEPEAGQESQEHRRAGPARRDDQQPATAIRACLERACGECHRERENPERRREEDRAEDLASWLSLREAGIDAAELLDRFDPERVDQQADHPTA